MAKPYFKNVPNFDYVSRTKDAQNISDYITVKNLFKRGKIRDDIFGDLTFFTKYKIIGDERPDNVAYKIYGDETLDWIILLSNNILNIHSEWPLPQTGFDKIMLEKYGSYDNLYNGIHHYTSKEIRNSSGAIVLPAGLNIQPNSPSVVYYDSGLNLSFNIESATYSDPDITITTTVPHGLRVNSTVTISEVSSPNYNGTYSVKSITNDTIFKVVAKSPTPNVPTAVLGSAKITISEITVPSSQFTNEVTNYEYEIQMEDDKRNIFALKPIYLNILYNDLETFMPYKKGSQQYVSETLKRGDNIRLY